MYIIEIVAFRNTVYEVKLEIPGYSKAGRWQGCIGVVTVGYEYSDDHLGTGGGVGPQHDHVGVLEPEHVYWSAVVFQDSHFAEVLC